MKERRSEVKNRRWFLKTVGAVALGLIATGLTDSAGLPQAPESRRELELQSLEWYKSWLADGRSVRLVDEQADLADLKGVRLIGLDLTRGLTCIDRPIEYTQQIPKLIQNFQKESLVEQTWLAQLNGGWSVSVSRYVNLAGLGVDYENLNQKTAKPIDYPKMLNDWSDKSIVTFSKTDGDYEIVWSISNTGGQSNPLLQGGRIERGDYTLMITSKKTGEQVVAVGFVSRLIEPGLDFQHALKNIGMHPLNRYVVHDSGAVSSYFNFGSLHPPGNFPLENYDLSVRPLNEKQLNVLIVAIQGFVSSTITPQIAG